MEKVKVNKEIFGALNNLMKMEKYNYGENKSYMIKKKAFSNFNNERKILNSMDNLEFAKCIILGYELEETKEEKLLRVYKEYENTSYSHGIERALYELDIKIEGINI